MSKIIIRNSSTVSDQLALDLVSRVIQDGRVSDEGKAYCFMTVFMVGNIEIAVSTKKNKTCDTFYVYTRGEFNNIK